MLRRVLLAFLVATLLPATSRAASWANEMFPVRQHDFGKLQRGDKPTFDFVVVNSSHREARIKAVRVSCACTKAIVPSNRISPGESTVLSATMDTSGFQGSKSVTIYVQFDRPWRAEVTLRVQCESVGKLGSEVTEIDFGILPQGSVPEKRLNLDYSGPLDWQIVDLDFGNANFQTEVTEVLREPGKVRYELKIRLAGSAGAGNHEDLIRVHTNDPATPQVLVKAKAQIEADVVVSPAAIRLGAFQPGDVVERKVMIKAAQPFKVLRVDNADGILQFKAGAEAKTVQLVTLTLTAPASSEDVPEHVDIVTDLGGERVLSVEIEK